MTTSDIDATALSQINSTDIEDIHYRGSPSDIILPAVTIEDKKEIEGGKIINWRWRRENERTGK